MARKLIEHIYQRMLSRSGLVLLLIMLVLNMFGLYATRAGDEAMQRALEVAGKARLVMVSMERLRALFFQFESAQRGFVLTQDYAYLRPFKDNLPSMKEELANIRRLTSERKDYDDLVRGVEEVARDKLQEMEKTIALAEFDSPEMAREFVRSDAGKQMMDFLDVSIQKLVETEDVIRKQSTEELSRIQGLMRWGLVAMFIVNALLIVAGTYTILLEFRRRQDVIASLGQRRRELEVAVRQSTAELRELSINLQNVQESERRRLARELHDELGGTLAAIKLDVSMAANNPAVVAEPKTHSRLQRATAALDDAIKVKRRIIEDLRPTLIDNLGFAAALRWHSEQFLERTGCRVRLDLPVGELVQDETQSIALFRCVQEALTNVQKYAEATEVAISVRQTDDQIEMTVTDNGIGIAEGKQHHPTSHGLIGMRERMTALGGNFEVTSSETGTRLRFVLPVKASAQDDALA